MMSCFYTGLLILTGQGMLDKKNPFVASTLVQE